MSQRITFADLQQIRDDEEKLKKLTSLVHTTYATLCALCRLDYSTMNQDDGDEDEDEDDEEITMSASRELVVVGDLAELSDLKSLVVRKSKNKGIDPYDFDDDEGQYDDEDLDRLRAQIHDAAQRRGAEADDEDFIVFEGQKSKKGDSICYGLKDLFRMVRQAAHPDKIMRFSAETKAKILECFHDAKEHYADENYPAMVLCYIEIFLLRGDPRPINYFLWKYAKQRHAQIEANLRYIMEKPYMPAITSYRNGNIERAKKQFKAYWASQQDDPMDDMDCFKK